MSIAFLLKILNIYLSKIVTEKGKPWVKSCLLKRLFNFTHHQATVLLPVFYRSLSTAHATPVLRGVRHALGMAGVLLC